MNISSFTTNNLNLFENFLKICELNDYPETKGKKKFLKASQCSENVEKIKLIIQSADLNFPPAIFTLGLISDKKYSHNYIRKAIDFDPNPIYINYIANHILRHHNLASGSMLLSEHVIKSSFRLALKKNYKEALLQCEKDYNNGNSLAYLLLSEFLSYIQVYSISKKVLEIGVQKKDQNSMLLLAKYYFNGYYGEINPLEAEKLLNKIDEPTNSDKLRTLKRFYFCEYNFNYIFSCNKKFILLEEIFNFICGFGLEQDLFMTELFLEKVDESKFTKYTGQFYYLLKILLLIKKDSIHEAIPLIEKLGPYQFIDNEIVLKETIDDREQLSKHNYLLGILNLMFKNLNSFINHTIEAAKDGSQKAKVTLYNLNNPIFQDYFTSRNLEIKEFSNLSQTYIDLKKLDPINTTNNLPNFDIEKLVFFIYLLDQTYLKNKFLSKGLTKITSELSPSSPPLITNFQCATFYKYIYEKNLKNVPGLNEFLEAHNKIISRRLELLKTSAAKGFSPAHCYLALLQSKNWKIALEHLDHAIKLLPLPLYFSLKKQIQNQHTRQYILNNVEWYTTDLEQRTADELMKLAFHYVAINEYEKILIPCSHAYTKGDSKAFAKIIALLCNLQEHQRAREFIQFGLNKFQDKYCAFYLGFLNHLKYFNDLTPEECRDLISASINKGAHELEGHLLSILITHQLDLKDTHFYLPRTYLDLSLIYIFGIGTKINTNLGHALLVKALYLLKIDMKSNQFIVLTLCYIYLKLGKFLEAKNLLEANTPFSLIIKNGINSIYATKPGWDRITLAFLNFHIKDFQSFTRNIYLSAKSFQYRAQIIFYYLTLSNDPIIQNEMSKLRSEDPALETYFLTIPIDLQKLDPNHSTEHLNNETLEKLIIYVFFIHKAYIQNVILSQIKTKHFEMSIDANESNQRPLSLQCMSEVTPMIPSHNSRDNIQLTNQDIISYQSNNDFSLEDFLQNDNDFHHTQFLENSRNFDLFSEDNIQEHAKNTSSEITNIFDLSEQEIIDFFLQEDVIEEKAINKELLNPAFQDTSQDSSSETSTNNLIELEKSSDSQKSPTKTNILRKLPKTKHKPTISSKYFSENGDQLPPIPIASISSRNLSIDEEKKYSLQPLKKMGHNCHAHEINREGLKAVYYSPEKRPTFDNCSRVTFVRTGRTVNALIPTDSDQSKIIMIASPNEFDEMIDYIDYNQDLLVIHEMPGYQNNIQDCLGNSSVRRLAALYFAWYNNISDIMILDDNIESFFAEKSVLPENCTWKDIYELYKSTSDAFNLTCLSVQTYSPISHQPLENSITINQGGLGYKVLFIHVNKIKQKIESPQYLLPQDPKLWGEDIFFQNALKNLNLEIGSFSKKTVLIKRAQANKNSSVGKVSPQNWLTHQPENFYPSFYSNTISDMKKIYEDNKRIYANKKDKIKKMNLSQETLKLYEKKRTRTETTNFASTKYEPKAKKTKNIQHKPISFTLPQTITPLSVDLYQEYAQKLELQPDFLRKPQIEAIQKFKERLENNITMGCFNMATGVGKTILYAYLVSKLTDCQNFNKNVLIITIGIQSSNQVFHSFKALNEKMNVERDIVLINSEYLSQRVFKINQTLTNHNNKTYIFCQESALAYFQKHPNEINRFGCIIMDEFHDFSKPFLKHLLEIGDTKSAMVLGFSATPPLLTLKEIYKYTLFQGYQDGLLAPWVIDKIRLPFLANKNKKKYDDLLKQLPTILQNHVHPHGKKLSENQGIIRVGKKIKTCATLVATEIAELLNLHHIASSAYHSLLSENQRAIILQNFAKKEIKVLVAVDMLGQAFDSQVDYVFFTKKIKSEADYFQNLGRVVRPSLNKRKIAYMIVPECTPLPNHAYLPADEPTFQILDRNYKIDESTYTYDRSTTFPITSQVHYQSIQLESADSPKQLNPSDFVRLPLKKGISYSDIFTLSSHIFNKNKDLAPILEPFFTFLFETKNDEKKKNIFNIMKQNGDKNINSILPELPPQKNGFLSIYRFDSKQYVLKELVGTHGAHLGIIFEKNDNEYEVLVPFETSRYFVQKGLEFKKLKTSK